jgi:hypothetical protein
MKSEHPLPQVSDSLVRVESPAHKADAPAPTFWLDGNAIMCACPDCGAPMSVRLWLCIADCWRCGTSIELTDEQEAEIRQLLHQSSSTTSQPAPAPHRGAATTASHSAAALAPVAAPRSVATSQEESEPDAPPRQRSLRTGKVTRDWMYALLSSTPAWLISLIVHLLILTLLAMLHFKEKGPHRIIISTTVSSALREGGDNVFEVPQDDEVHFDLPMPENVDLTSDRIRKAMVLADQDAKELRIDSDASVPQLPNVGVVKRRLGETNDISAALAARDPRIRVEMVRREGGTTLTEAAVSRGLRWIAKQQLEDGSWSLRGHDGGAGLESRASATGMALLAFLGAGQTHLVGHYQGEVSLGLRWLLDHQGEDGDLRAGSDHQAGMYAHGQAAIALCEAFALTGDEKLRGPAEKAIRYIASAQYSDGGWRYSPEEPLNPPGGDTSVVGWQLMALQSARAARLDVPDYTLELANQFLDRVEHDGGATYSYRPEEQPTATMTAEALLCRMYLGWKRETPGIRDGVRYLAEQNLPDANNWNIYYWYYGTLTMHNFNDADFDTWHRKMRKILIESQSTKGCSEGSWDPVHPSVDTWGEQGGRLMMTSLNTLTLEVYYRCMPLFQTDSLLPKAAPTLPPIKAQPENAAEGK